MAALIDGPRLAPKSRNAKQLIVFLHGYGADGSDLIAIAKQWQAFMPDAAFVSPNAPEPCSQAPSGRQWFPLTMRDPNERWIGVNKAAPGLDAFLDAELQRHGLDESKLALVGFSQGTMVALHVGLRRKRALAAIVGYSGAVVGPEHLSQATAHTPAGKAPPILLIHGSEDPVIPTEALFLSAEDLAKADIPTQWHLSMGLGHGIDGAGLMHGGLFLAQCFKLKLDRDAKVRI
ncbi:MAG: dienelactone hydrolase family protein [Methylocella sp.]